MRHHGQKSELNDIKPSETHTNRIHNLIWFNSNENNIGSRKSEGEHLKAEDGAIKRVITFTTFA